MDETGPVATTLASTKDSYAIIREIYENQDSREYFENELEQALVMCYETIVIEPTKLGEETARWIAAGNCLHKTAVLSALSCLVIGGIFPQRLALYVPFGFTAAVCASTYAVSWQLDPCCQYQVVRQVDRQWTQVKLPELVKHDLSSTSPVVLIRRNDTRRRWLHNSVSLLASGVCAYQLYKCYFQ